MIWLIITIAVILLYLFALAPRLSRRDAMRAFSGTMFAHRGYHCKERGIPENSMKAFRAAIARGYGIELDLHLTKTAVLPSSTTIRWNACAKELKRWKN